MTIPLVIILLIWEGAIILRVKRFRIIHVLKKKKITVSKNN